ncbi:MH2 domain-containing protein [Trichonephila inaurata madagascariensis]|uniref:MH2 domain-containing protein n=1 Tax=Trichonephila inaurata madagascariensis TaxID=2747483 RepID=A0A8X6WU51_9ARAC|nr:MH2 domain-containing protein [Trichonephila inaurata madagascariensis]
MEQSNKVYAFCGVGPSTNTKRNVCSVVSVPSPRNFVSRYFPVVEECFCSNVVKRYSTGSTLNKMVSRRKILSRSRDGLNSDFSQEEEDDVWFQKERLFKDHIQEVLNKWKQIDDEIWAKIIVMERNRRVAKAYARAPVLTINGSDDGFDGYRIGLCGFDNPMRDAKTEEIKKHIGHGVKIKMDEAGNIMVKRISKSNVYVKEIKSEENSIASDIIMAGGLLEMEKPVKLFDMKKFTANVNGEIRKTYPDRRKLESQCISAFSFVKDCPELLDCPCWVMVINVVALDMLRSKLPVPKRASDRINDRRQMPLPTEEDPYSVLNSSDGVSQRMSDTLKESKPPKLPPRDLNRVPVPVPDYDDWKREKPTQRMNQQSGYKDDPYYCGMKARVPNFGKKTSTKAVQPAQHPTSYGPVRKSHSSGYLSLLRQNDKTFDSGRETDPFMDEEYSRLYGRMRTLTSPASPGVLYVGEWE